MCHEEMIDILTHLQKYVPCKSYVKTLNLEPYTQTVYELVTTLVCGDQLTTAHGRQCIKVKENSENNLDKLCGLLPVIEDWHAKVCCVEVRV